MGIRLSVSGMWIGMVLALGLGTVGAQTQNAAPVAAPTVADSGAKAVSKASAAKVGKKRELTAEQKAFEQSVKAMRTQSGEMNAKFIKAERKREKARRKAEKAGKTPSAGVAKEDSAGNGADGKVK